MMSNAAGEESKAKETKKKKSKDEPLARCHIHYEADKPRPKSVRQLMEKIQIEMMDWKDSSPKTFPEMPSKFICSEVTNAEKKKKMVEFCDSALLEDQCSCYEMFVAFRINELEDAERSLVWLNELIISFKNANLKEETFKDLIVIEIERFRKLRKNKKRIRSSKYVYKSIPKEDAIEKLPSKLGSFFKGKLKANLKGKARVELVGRYPANTSILHPNCPLLSSHRMTVSWLRSKLHKAVNKCLKSKSTSGTPHQAELVPLIRQKKEGPLFLQLPYEDSGDGTVKRCYVLFAFYPAFRVGSSCDLIVPVVPHFDNLPEKLDGDAEEFLWKRITKCFNKEEGHQHKILKIEESKLELEKKRTTPSSLQASSNSSKERTVCEDVKRDLTASQILQCRECRNPASRMLLEYYFQYGYIPEEEMSFAESFVDEILQFIKRSIQKDRRSNDPKVLEFVKSGSVPEKLKVVQPDEFDVMVKIRLPASKMEYSLYSDDAFPPGFTICRVKATGAVSPSLKQCFLKVDAFETEYCLNPGKLAFGWLYGMLQRAINKYKNPSNSPKAHLKIKRGGPAIMLQITPNASTSDGPQPSLPKQIKVDLVLALERSSTDGRLFVPKGANLKSFYNEKKKTKKMKLEPSSSEENADRTIAEEKKVADEKKHIAKRNIQYMWRISYSAEEKEFLEYVDEKQRECGVQGCQNICLKILKTICMREALKSEESVICHKLSSYILKTTLFHMLSRSDLNERWEDWKIECLAERYVEFLRQLSKLEKELHHFFFGNNSYLRGAFNDVDRRCKETKSVDLLENFDATLKIQLLDKISCIVKSFEDCKKEMSESMNEFQNQQDSSDSIDNDQVYLALLDKVLGGKSPEEIIHPSVVVREKCEEYEETKKKLKESQQDEQQRKEAAKNDQRSGFQLNIDQNMKSAQIIVEDKKSRKRKVDELEEDDDECDYAMYDYYKVDKDDEDNEDDEDDDIF